MTAHGAHLRGFFAIGALVLTGCGAAPERAAPSAVAPLVPGTRYTTIVFPAGAAALGRDHKALLRELLATARRDRKPVEEIRVLAWADEEYPEGGKKPPPSPKAESLAAARALAIRDFLAQDLGEARDIDAYNMARRPTVIARLFRSDEFRVKDAFEQSGATASPLPDGRTSYTKASKALVIIDYEDEDDNL
jgi:hypothetical protein